MLESINSEGRDEHNQTTSDMGAAGTYSYEQ